MENESNNCGIYIQGGSKITVEDNEIQGYNCGIHAENTIDLKVSGNVIQRLTTTEFNDLKSQIVSEIESTLDEIRNGNNNKRTKHLFNFITSFSSACLIESLKAYGILPN
ncbi:hypothetical protein [Sedimentibacter sp. MB31-C6]|uniref:hypothetical protein n=1 Tax=Sedimentibacter sp. MB31-C6 TaxID=3109366 RepID=UPI002DDD7A25|nr:hypothetical protein [Sedimentibacter sp. MB36-C1]WSI03570.1 hypothetical protein U8307_10980 [Sedimentibacter sp. MB36-C1]